MAKGNGSQGAQQRRLRSQLWFDNPDNPGMTALYLERYLNYGLTRAELTSGKPIIGIAQTGSDLSPCNRHHLELAKRVRAGIHDAGGLAFEFPVHPIQETGKRPTASLDRNLAYLGLVEVLYGYPLDGVVLTTGCDKTVPACLMAAATVNTPAIVLSGGPMLDSYRDGALCRFGRGRLAGAPGPRRRQDRLQAVHRHRRRLRAVDRSLQHDGHRLDHERHGRGARHVAARLRRDPGALSRARADRLRNRPARGRDRARRPQALRHSHPGRIRERDRRLLGHRRLDQRAHSPRRHRAPCRRQAHGRGLGDGRLRCAAPPQHAAGGRISRRRILSRRRAAGGDERTARGRPAQRQRAHHQRQDRCRERRQGQGHQRGGHPPVQQAAAGEGGFQGAPRQSVRFGDHEDERHLRGVSAALSQRPEGSECLRRPRRRVRRARGLSPSHR